MRDEKIYTMVKLQENERFETIVRQAPYGMVLKMIIPILIIIADFFLFYYLSTFGQVGVIIFLVIIVICALMIFMQVLKWQHTALVITNRRLIDIDQEKLFSKTISEVYIERIDEVLCQTKGLVQLIARTGNLQITIQNSRTKLLITHIRNPRAVQQRIIDLKASSTHHQSVSQQLLPDRESLRNMARIMHRHLSPEEIKRLFQEVSLEQ